VELNPEIERWVQEEIQRGHFHSVEEAIELAVSALMREKSQVEQIPVQKPKKNFAQFLLDSPLPGSGLRLERPKDYPLPIDLRADR
jgi:Arc/MetJ-type ribon-helix-helix transcriptional regulator